MEILNQISKILNRAEFIERELSDKQLKLDLALKKRSDLDQEQYLVAGSIEVIKLVVEKISESSIEALVELSNEALKFIMDDRDIRVGFYIGEVRGSKTLEFYTVEKKGNDLIRSNLRTSTGRGIRTVVGLMMIHFYLEMGKLYRFVVLDEVISAIADMYLENLFVFLKKLGTEGGYSYLLIEHDSRIDSFLDKKYVMNNGTLTEVSYQKRE